MSDPTSDGWRVVANDNGAIVVNQAGHCVAIISCLAGTNEPVRDIKAQVADAHLIAAAPDMREALRDLVQKYESQKHLLGLGDGRMAKAIASLAKAEGEA